MARLYANENFPQEATDKLIASGHDVTSVRERPSWRSMPDAEVLASASEEGRAVVTHNKWDFLKLHKESQGSHAGIVACSTDDDFARLARGVHEAVSGCPDLRGQVLRVDRPAG